MDRCVCVYVMWWYASISWKEFKKISRVWSWWVFSYFTLATFCDAGGIKTKAIQVSYFYQQDDPMHNTICAEPHSQQHEEKDREITTAPTSKRIRSSEICILGWVQEMCVCTMRCDGDVMWCDVCLPSDEQVWWTFAWSVIQSRRNSLLFPMLTHPLGLSNHPLPVSHLHSLYLGNTCRFT